MNYEAEFAVNACANTAAAVTRFKLSACPRLSNVSRCVHFAASSSDNPRDSCPSTSNTGARKDEG